MYCRTRVSPRLTVDACESLRNQFVSIRAEHRAKVRDGSVIPITVRQLEAIVRLSESIARMYAIIFDMHSKIVTLCTCPARLTSRTNTCVRRCGCSG